TAEYLLEALHNDPASPIRIADLEAAIADGALPPTLAAQRLVASFVSTLSERVQSPRRKED
ncbi:MAG: hypothetical protein OES09_16045, partial [Gammaproteobacteria bacterium]|nr:hypothetical protein [Gammaproteobacteria bacterium]